MMTAALLVLAGLFVGIIGAYVGIMWALHGVFGR